MVRVGQALLGYSADDVPPKENFEFRAAMEALEPSIRALYPFCRLTGPEVRFGSKADPISILIPGSSFPSL